MTGVLKRLLFKSVAVVFVMIIFLLAYLVIRDPPSKWHSPPIKLSIALPVLPDAALVHIAAAKGYFAEVGLEVSIQPVSHGVAAIGYVRDGKADVAVAAEVPFVIAVLKGSTLGMIASLVSISNHNAIIARRDHAIASAQDLAGKTIGITFGTSGSYFLWAYLIKHKLAPDSITLVDFPPGKLVGALVNGSVDAVATWQPITFEARAALKENALFLTEADAYKTTFGVFGPREFLKAQPHTVERLVRAMLKAEKFMRVEPEETLNLVAKWLEVDVGVLRPTWAQFDFKVTLEQSQLITLEEEVRWAMARGYVTKGPVPNLLPHLYLDALLAVQPERVTVLR